jgi:hypothetical protein
MLRNIATFVIMPLVFIPIGMIVGLPGQKLEAKPTVGKHRPIVETFKVRFIAVNLAKPGSNQVDIERELNFAHRGAKAFTVSEQKIGTELVGFWVLAEYNTPLPAVKTSTAVTQPTTQPTTRPTTAPTTQPTTRPTTAPTTQVIGTELDPPPTEPKFIAPIERPQGARPATQPAPTSQPTIRPAPNVETLDEAENSASPTTQAAGTIIDETEEAKKPSEFNGFN